jgi:dTMP kinase
VTKRSTHGNLIVFKGPDGAGKTTLARELSRRLGDSGVPCEYVAFPGQQHGTLGRLIYDLHHNPKSYGINNINATSLQVLHLAAHVDAIEGQILPALKAGRWIVLDRFWWSTWVYGSALGVNQHRTYAFEH